VLRELIVWLSNTIGHFHPESLILHDFGNSDGAQSMHECFRLIIGETVVVAPKRFKLGGTLGYVELLNKWLCLGKDLTNALHLAQVQKRVPQQKTYVDLQPGLLWQVSYIPQGFERKLQMLHGFPVR